MKPAYLFKILSAIIVSLLILFFVFTKWQDYHRGNENNGNGLFKHFISDYAARYGLPKNSVSFSQMKNGGLQVDVVYNGMSHKEIFTKTEIEKLNANIVSSQTVEKVKKLFLNYKSVPQ